MGSGVLGAQTSLGRNDSATPPPKFLTPLMMCCGGILTTTRRVTSSFGPEVLIPSMGDRSGSEKEDCWFGGIHRFSYIFLPLAFPNTFSSNPKVKLETKPEQ